VRADRAVRAESTSDDALTRADDVEGTDRSAAASLAMKVVLYTVQASSCVLVLAARHFGIIANKPLWAYAAAIVGSSLVSQRMDTWTDVPRGSWRLHLRLFVHAATVTSVIYLTGWGPALGVCFVYVALVDLQQSGSEAWRAVLGWALAGCTAGQLLVLQGWMPTFLSRSAGQGLGFLGAFGFSIVIRMAGAIGIAKEQAEVLLAEQTVQAARARDEAQASAARHRAVVEHAADGILTIDADTNISSFNAAAEAMFGWDGAEIIGRPASTIVASNLHDALAAFLAAGETSASARGSGEVETAGMRRNGTQFPMMVSWSSIRTDSAAPSLSAIVRDLSSQKHLEAQLTHQALHDPLTGLPNRSLFNDRLERALARRLRNGGFVAVIVIDLDGFKVVNDSLGHLTGDALLVAVSERFRTSLREVDTIARLGGDEFAVLVDDLDAPDQAGRVAQRVLDTMQAPLQLPDRTVVIGASVGIALADGPDCSAVDLFSNADAAMYRAKREGKGCYRIFEASMHAAAVERMELEQALRNAIANHALTVHYQPVVDTATGRVLSFEALARWHDPERGFIPPDVFIHLAEESGLIVEIGRGILLEACAQASIWRAANPELHLGLAVNVSVRQFGDPGFVADVAAALAQAQLEPSALTLEITESVLASDSGRIIGALDELRRTGVRIAIDDFGTGYSSFATLAELPIDTLKGSKNPSSAKDSRSSDATASRATSTHGRCPPTRYTRTSKAAEHPSPPEARSRTALKVCTTPPRA
jgi:diguanylate cyclase (GGDEF)-like protein/PAS domain S-box-containing protein